MELRAQLETLGEKPLLITGWTYVEHGGSNFKDQTIKIKQEQAKVRLSSKGLMFYGFFIGLGLLALINSPYQFFVTGVIEGGVFMLLFGSLFAGAGYLLLPEKPLIFDRQQGVFFTGKHFDSTQKKHGKLTNIHALQIISEYVRDTGTSSSSSKDFTSYELNLILTCGKRINILDHSHLKVVREEAVALSDFLNINVWQVID